MTSDTPVSLNQQSAMTTDTDELITEIDTWLGSFPEDVRLHGGIPIIRAGIKNLIRQHSAKRHTEGRPAVEGKPLELMTRDELLSYIRHSAKRDAMQVGDAQRILDLALFEARACVGNTPHPPIFVNTIERIEQAIAALNNTSHKEG
jgi:hypothetical protein